MNAENSPESTEQRRQPRVSIPEHPQIIDTHNGKVLGQLVNLSIDGLMAVSHQCIECGTVCQLRVPLVRDGQTVEILIGAESLWCEDANDSGSHWTGFQIIDISPEHQEILNSVVTD